MLWRTVSTGHVPGPHTRGVDGGECVSEGFAGRLPRKQCGSRELQREVARLRVQAAGAFHGVALQDPRVDPERGELERQQHGEQHVVVGLRAEPREARDAPVRPRGPRLGSSLVRARGDDARLEVGSSGAGGDRRRRARACRHARRWRPRTAGRPPVRPVGRSAARCSGWTARRRRCSPPRRPTA